MITDPETTKQGYAVECGIDINNGPHATYKHALVAEHT